MSSGGILGTEVRSRPCLDPGLGHSDCVDDFTFTQCGNIKSVSRWLHSSLNQAGKSIRRLRGKELGMSTYEEFDKYEEKYRDTREWRDAKWQSADEQPT